jgi:uncharacterized Zn finger protein (UPF0148 family)
LVECPECRTWVVASPVKTWSMIGKPSKTGKRFKLTLGVFQCPKCEKRFRVVLGKEKITIKHGIEEIKRIETELMQTLRNLREKIQKLENEKANLMAEIEELRKAGEKKASALEKEVTTLKKEAKSLKKLLENSE